MATTGIVAGVLGEGLLVLTALLETCTNKAILPMCSKMASFLFTLCAGKIILYQFSMKIMLNNNLVHRFSSKNLLSKKNVKYMLVRVDCDKSWLLRIQ